MEKSGVVKTGKPGQTLPGGGKNVDITKLHLRRERPAPKVTEDEVVEEKKVSAGPIDKALELAFNPTREKMREVTIIDRLQGRLFPIMDTMGTLFMKCVGIAMYRQDPEKYEEVFKKKIPVPMFDITDELMYRTAQWQKSVAGNNLAKITDIALAEMETKPDDEDIYAHGRGYED